MRQPLTADILAGLSVAGLLLPEAVAYSGIANLPPQAGIVGLVIGLACYGLLGTSRFALVAATSSSAAVLLAIVRSLQPHDIQQQLAFSAALVVMAGVFLVIAGSLRIGHVAHFIAKPVLRGFVFALSVVITIKQIAAMAAVHPSSSKVIPMTYELVSRWREWNGAGLALGLTSLAALLALAPIRKIPAPLIVLVASIIVTQQWGALAQRVSLVGSIDVQSFRIDIPRLPESEWLRLGEVAVALLLILFAESYSSIQTFALRHGDEVAINRDLIALGIANLIAGVCHGTPVGAGFSATAANEAAGAQSRVAGLTAGLSVVVLLIAFLPQISKVPEPVLAAIVIYALRRSLSFRPLQPYWRWRRDFVVASVAVVAVFALGILDGLLVAVLTSVVLLLRTFSQPHLTELGRLDGGHDFVALKSHPAAQRVQGLLIVRPEEPLFFANVEPIFALTLAQLDAREDVQTVVLSLEESPDLDGTSLEALGEFNSALQKRNKRLLLARVKDKASEALNLAALTVLLPQDRDAHSVDDVVNAATGHGFHNGR